MRFYFSSDFNKKRFDEKVDNYIESESNYNFNRYKVKILLDEIFAIAFYKKIEKRGFSVFDVRNNRFITTEKIFVIG